MVPRMCRRLGRCSPGRPVGRTYADRVDIDAVIAALGSHYDADGAAEIERVLRAYNGTIPDDQLLSEASLALAIRRRGWR